MSYQFGLSTGGSESASRRASRDLSRHRRNDTRLNLNMTY